MMLVINTVLWLHSVLFHAPYLQNTNLLTCCLLLTRLLTWTVQNNVMLDVYTLQPFDAVHKCDRRTDRQTPVDG